MNSDQWRYPRGVIDPTAPIVLPGGPLQLYERGIWDPAAQYWGEPEDTIAASIAQVIAGGPRMEFEFEQILPAHGDPDSDDAIIDAMELRDRGDAAAASSLLGGLLERGREVPRRARPPGRSGVQRGRRATSARSLRNRRTNSRALTAGALQRGSAVGLDRQPPVPALPARRRAERVASRRTAPRGNALLGAAVAESRRQPGRQRRPVRDHRGRTLAPVTGG